MPRLHGQHLATACEILGREPEGMLGRFWLFLIPQSDYGLFTSYERAVIRHYGRNGSGRLFPSLRMRFTRPGGEIVHVRVAVTWSRSNRSASGTMPSPCWPTVSTPRG